MQPVLIQITDSFYLPTYGFMIAVGLVVALFIAARRGAARGIHADVFYDITMVAVVTGFVSARLLYIILNFGEFLSDPASMIFTRSGFVFLGGFIGAALGIIVYIKIKHLDLLKVADVLVPSLAIGHAFGRIGCHLTGCCYGGLCTGPLGIRVPLIRMKDGTVHPNAYVDHWTAGLIPEGGSLYSQPIWPVQLMESGFLFLLGIGLIILAARPVRKGLIFGIYLVAYGLGRSILETFRGDVERGEGLLLGMSTSQLLSIPLVVAGVVVIHLSRKNELVGPTKIEQKKDDKKPAE